MKQHTLKRYDFYIGIDTGTNTGFAIYSKASRKIILLETLSVHKAMQQITNLNETKPGTTFNPSFIVRVEDARKRKWFGKNSHAKLQGAGSVKRDAKIWEDFLTDLGVTFEMVAPKNNTTKLNAETFKKITGWMQPTNEHERDAAMLVFGL